MGVCLDHKNTVGVVCLVCWDDKVQLVRNAASSPISLLSYRHRCHHAPSAPELAWTTACRLLAALAASGHRTRGRRCCWRRLSPCFPRSRRRPHRRQRGREAAVSSEGCRRSTIVTRRARPQGLRRVRAPERSLPRGRGCLTSGSPPPAALCRRPSRGTAPWTGCTITEVIAVLQNKNLATT
jgi:hypothetical protein